MISVDVDLLKAFPDYSSYGNSSVDRVRFVLMKLDSDYKHDTDYFGHKFMSKVESIFNGLPKPKDWRSLYINDLPLLTSIDDEMQAVAVHRSNNQNRDATPGQKAMATAMAFPDNTEKGGRGKKAKTVDLINGFDKSLLSRARYVLRNSPMVEGPHRGKRQWRLRCSGLMESTEAIEEISTLEAS